MNLLTHKKNLFLKPVLFLSIFIALLLPKYSYGQSCPILRDEFNQVINLIAKGNKVILSRLEKCKRANKELIIRATTIDYNQFEYADFSLKDDEYFVLDLLNYQKGILQFVSQRLTEDQFFIKQAIKNRPDIVSDIDPKFLDDKLFARFLLDIDVNNYRFLSKRLKNDYDITLKAVSENGFLLKYASSILKEDEHIVKEAVKSYNRSIQFADELLQENEEIIQLSQSIDYGFLQNFNLFLDQNYFSAEVNFKYCHEIINQGKLSSKLHILDRPYQTRLREVTFDDYDYLTYKLEQIKALNKIGFAEEFAKYPKLLKKIREILKTNNVSFVDGLGATSIWEVENQLMAFNLYLLKDIEQNIELNSVTSVSAIAFFDQDKWHLSLVEKIIERQIKANILNKHGHKKYVIWDLFKKDNVIGVLFKVIDDEEEYLEFFVKQKNNKFVPVYKYQKCS